jgi:pimeloyl-ACP methyl ester carboxylesterase
MLPAKTFPSIADKMIEVDGIKIAYKEKGTGQPILCLHPIAHSSKDFQPLFDLLSDSYRIIALDFPGQGLSAPSPTPVSATYYAELTRNFISKLLLDNLTIIGNSIGGAVAIRLAYQNPSIKCIVLADPGGLDKGGFFAPLFINYYINFFKKGVGHKPSFQRDYEKYYERVLPSATSAARRKELTEHAYELAPLLVQAWTSFKQKNEDLRTMISGVHCPVLFIWGLKDKIIQYNRNKDSIKKFYDHALITYPIGHSPLVVS